ncbi:N-acetylmuramoyl-L-alanine amidase family protein [Lachnospiraceae bacterium 62-35]
MIYRHWNTGTGSAKRMAAVFLAAVFAVSAIPFNGTTKKAFTAQAADKAAKAINTVSIKVSSDIEAGVRLPDITIGDKSAPEGGVSVSSSNSKYEIEEAEWVDKVSSEGVEIASEPRMKVTLKPAKVSDDYFLANYKESSVKITGGKFVSARRDGNNLVVTLRINAVKGDYIAPSDAYWYEKNLGEARWEEPENSSGYYELQLYRGTRSIHHVAKVSAKNYNFYPYMTEKGEYTFKVRTIPSTDTQKKYGKKSDWVESGELEITDRYVSDGKGQQNQNQTVKKGTTDSVGWFKEGNEWYYRYPDGSLITDRWEMINGQWYYFDGAGKMAVGWKNIGESRYYFWPGGEMAIGWGKIDDKWYYFRPEAADGRPAGSMAGAGWRVIGPYYYYFNEDGSMHTGWLTYENEWYYLNTVDNSLMGAMFTGWIKRDNETYFADANGVIIKGWYQIDGDWYYFYPEDGRMAHDTDIEGLHIGPDGIWKK